MELAGKAGKLVFSKRKQNRQEETDVEWIGEREISFEVIWGLWTEEPEF